MGAAMLLATTILFVFFHSRGMTRSQKKKGKRAHQESPFREAFGKLGELRALLPECPVVALSASLSV